MPKWLLTLLGYVPLVGRVVASKTKTPVDDAVVEIGGKIIKDVTEADTKRQIEAGGAATELWCTKCGTPWPLGFKYCSKCGAALSG